MKVEEITQVNQSCKLPRKKGDDEGDGEVKRRSNGGGGGGGFDFGSISGWPSSRIVRVSRASGGKDRHSKVLTSKGLRDRRVRLSVNTAIQFYDLQDRLGYDQPSKAVEWLLQAAASSIAELPTINVTSFPDTTNTATQQHQLTDEKRSTDGPGHGFGSAGAETGGSFERSYQQSQQQLTKTALSVSACSSNNSETSKGSGLSLSRSERRERAMERAVEKEKETINEEHEHENHQIRPNVNPISQNACSFTELLTNGASGLRQWPSTPMDYFTSELVGPTGVRTTYFGDQQFQEMQTFAFITDHSVPFVTHSSNNNNNNENDLNFTISTSSSSSGVAGFSRGTLQSNSLLPQFQRFSSTDGSLPPSPFFIGAVPPLNNHHHHHCLTGFDAQLQLCNADARNSDYKGKGKS